MGRMAWWCGALVLLGLLQTAEAACRVEPRASVPLALVQNVPLVEVALDGKPATFVLDTGAERSVIAAAAIPALGLARDPWVSTGMRGIGGTPEQTANVLLRSFELGGVPLRRRAVNPTLSFAVTPLPWQIAGRTVSGLLGADYLSPFDLDLDFPKNRLTLAETRDCGTAPIPWEPPHAVVPLLRPRPFTYLAPVRIDGTTLQAQLDTGANVSLISARGAARLGVDLSQGTAGSARGVGRQRLPLVRRTFAAVSLGPIVMRDVPLALGAPPSGYPFDMLLGMDLLQRQHLFVSYATDRLLIATP